MLSIEEYEKFQKSLKDLEVKISVLEERQKQLVERLKSEFGLTPEQAQQKLVELRETLPAKEAEFERRFEEFKNQCALVEQN